jgi:hypothetical protein
MWKALIQRYMTDGQTRMSSPANAGDPVITAAA